MADDTFRVEILPKIHSYLISLCKFTIGTGHADPEIFEHLLLLRYAETCSRSLNDPSYAPEEQEWLFASLCSTQHLQATLYSEKSQSSKILNRMTSGVREVWDTVFADISDHDVFNTRALLTAIRAFSEASVSSGLHTLCGLLKRRSAYEVCGSIPEFRNMKS
ncbi:MAG: hypothetical protein Q9159_002380 [Coniocarpon cinnabarinum]